MRSSGSIRSGVPMAAAALLRIRAPRRRLQGGSLRAALGASLVACALLLGGCGGGDAASDATPAAAAAAAADLAAAESRRAVVAAAADAARPPTDRARDAAEKPVDVLSFFGVGPGMKVVQLFGGDGYLTELLAHAVGPQGIVYVTRLDDDSRLARLGNVREVQDVPAEVPANSIDRVVVVAGYHQAVNMGIDRAQLIGGTVTALKADGVVGIVDHSAQPGSRERDVGTLHRIEQGFVVEEMTGLGFLPAGQLDVLRNRGDNRTLMDTEESIVGRTDRFVLKFIRPAGLKAPLVEVVPIRNEIIEAGMPGGIDGTSGSAAVQEVVEDVHGRIDAYGDAVTAGQKPVAEPAE